MAEDELLFYGHDLRAVLELQEKKAHEAVENINPDSLLGSNPEDVCTALEEDFRVNVPVLKEDAIQMEQQETRVDVSQDWNRGILDRSRPFYIKGTEITFFVPFEGDAALFHCQPSSFNLNPPRGVVKAGELVLSYVRVDQDAAAVKREFENDLSSVRQYLGWIANQVNRFNKELGPKLEQWVAARRERLLRDKGMAAALGYPLRRRANAPQTYVAPTVRRKTAIAKPASAVKPFLPEPTLEMTEYEHILSVMMNMVAVMERSPQAFHTMKEEDLRQHFLVQLNGQYEGQATGETFNFEGKTDILIRVEGKNIFIAECKFWDGPKSLNDAIDQLLGYASWRDTKTAILVFNRGRNLTTVLQKIPEVVKAHSHFKRQLEYRSETGFRFVLHHRDDKSRELILTVLTFEVPA